MSAVHPQSITGAAVKACSQVIQSFRVAARPGLAAVAAAAAKEIKLFLNATIHGLNHGASFVRAFPQVVGEIRNV